MVNISAYRDITNALGQVQLIVVSKFKSAQDIQVLYNEGQRAFGENYVQEMVAKYDTLPQDIQWHFIGHLQRNKVKYIVPFVAMIQSVDSFRLLQEINKQAALNDRQIDVLIQVYVGNENTKYGLDEKETLELLAYYEAQQADLQNVRIRGFMGMASLTEDEVELRREFNTIAQMFAVYRTQFFLGKDYFDTLSMGMSSDYTLAVQEKSTMVRIGSTLFGRR